MSMLAFELVFDKEMSLTLYKKVRGGGGGGRIWKN